MQEDAGAEDAQKTGEPIYIGNMGAGDMNADWIKHVDGGIHQRRDLAAHHMIMARYYDAQGETEKAEHERELAAILLGEDTHLEGSDLRVAGVSGTQILVAKTSDLNAGNYNGDAWAYDTRLHRMSGPRPLQVWFKFGTWKDASVLTEQEQSVIVENAAVAITTGRRI